jgi:hypothetical protein
MPLRVRACVCARAAPRCALAPHHCGVKLHSESQSSAPAEVGLPYAIDLSITRSSSETNAWHRFTLLRGPERGAAGSAQAEKVQKGLGTVSRGAPSAVRPARRGTSISIPDWREPAGVNKSASSAATEACGRVAAGAAWRLRQRGAAAARSGAARARSAPRRTRTPAAVGAGAARDDASAGAAAAAAAAHGARRAVCDITPRAAQGGSGCKRPRQLPLRARWRKARVCRLGPSHAQSTWEGRGWPRARAGRTSRALRLLGRS